MSDFEDEFLDLTPPQSPVLDAADSKLAVFDTSNTNQTSHECECAYCGIDNHSCLIKCQICDKWFCNGKAGNKGSHIITHLVLSKHNRISLHPESPLGDSALECYNCGSQNIFSLGFVSAKQDNVVVLLCRIPCAQLKDSDWDTQNWLSLIDDRHLVNWICKPPFEEDMLKSRMIDYSQITALEKTWRSNQDATFDEINNNEIEEINVDPILIRYEDAYQYQNAFAPLVKIEADYDKARKESKALSYISVSWSVALNHKHLAKFCFSNSDYSTMNVSVGDEMILRYDGPELDYKWESSGYIVRLPDARQEEYTFELTERNSVPTHINNRFTAEFVWKGISYDRMQNALKEFAVNSKAISELLYLKLLGIEVNKALFTVKLPDNLNIPGMPALNESQLHAVENALKSPLTLIQGPPGTGKTVTSSAIIYHLRRLYPKEKILVCAPSNVAVDHLTEKLVKMGMKVMRIVSKIKEDIESDVQDYCLHEMVKSNAQGDFKMLIAKRAENGELNPEDHYRYMSQLKKKEKKLISNADIICCTCVGAADPRIANINFRSVLIDESTQATEPECLIPMVKGASQVILVGDHQQLGPVILNKKASDAGLRQSLFERLIILGHAPIRLEVQYRMHPSLSEFPSNMFYDGSLQNGITAKDRLIRNQTFPWPIREIPMMFWATYGREEISYSGTSYLNRIEAMKIENIVTRLIHDGISPSNIGIITPYEGQRNYILQYLQLNSTLETNLYDQIEVVSVDAFQGREKDYIILSCVRANSQQTIGFLRDPRRLNVALTRAKYGMMIVGNPKALYKDKLWNSLLKFYRANGCLVEGTLENLQLSSVQLTRFTNTEKRNTNASRFKNDNHKASDNGSIVSYANSSYKQKQRTGLNDDSVWPSLNDYTQSVAGTGIESDDETVISNANIDEPLDELTENIRQLTQKFGGDFTF